MRAQEHGKEETGEEVVVVVQVQKGLERRQIRKDFYLQQGQAELTFLCQL